MTPPFWQGPISGTMTCDDCHAMVAGAHMARHQEWHAKLREEGDAARSDEQAQDDEDDSHEESASDEADDAPDDEDDGEDPEEQVHGSSVDEETGRVDEDEDLAGDVEGEVHDPWSALSMGVGNIVKAISDCIAEAYGPRPRP